MKNFIKRFIALEASSGIVLLVVTALAIIVENSGLQEIYHHLLHLPIGIEIGTFKLENGLSHWINDGLMVIFFLLVGMEIKREIIQGHLSTREQLLLPLIGAAGGMLLPALIFVWRDHGDPYALRGWAIPSATDIAFALGILSLLGKRVPTSLKVFLTALAVLDDMGAVVIIALFYSQGLAVEMLSGAGLTLLMLYALNRRGVTSLAPYLVLGFFLWVFMLLSGVHATVAGVLLALTIPLRAKNKHGESPLLSLVHSLHPYVAFGIMPVFAFANAGLPLAGLSLSELLQPIPSGIASGLFFGKQIGVFVFSFIAVKLRICHAPKHATWAQLYGVAILTGIGFTMSLFVGSLAYREEGYAIATRLGVLSGSLASSLLGLVFLWWATRTPTPQSA